MQLGLVVGTATATVKHSTLQGWKLLIVQPLLADGLQPDGDPQLIVDRLGAGTGQRVIMNSEGRAIREMMKTEKAPVRWSVMGIVDE
ncbi:MAG TPA: EutN/CcmL family microcompartment protein [Pirellulales bacterium]|jgi:ethanolamine utilization protein EutN|nr:EutN/CcmL family microcompartment protein [Pirellulales bacterium]